jgi:hypothetical protein
MNKNEPLGFQLMINDNPIHATANATHLSQHLHCPVGGRCCLRHDSHATHRQLTFRHGRTSAAFSMPCTSPWKHMSFEPQMATRSDHPIKRTMMSSIWKEIRFTVFDNVWQHPQIPKKGTILAKIQEPNCMFICSATILSIKGCNQPF